MTEKRKVVVAGLAALALCCGPTLVTATISHGHWPAILLGLGLGTLLSISLLVWVFEPPDPDSDFDF